MTVAGGLCLLLESLEVPFGRTRTILEEADGVISEEQGSRHELREHLQQVLWCTQINEINNANIRVDRSGVR